MTSNSAGTFLHSLRESRLLEPAQIDELTSTPDAANTDPRALGQCLVEMGWLTPFQVERLIAGRAQDLTLGTYQLLDRLGQGDGGSTYKARRPGKPGVVALKVVPKARLATPEATAKFMQDVRSAAQLQHEHIAPLATVSQVGAIYLCAREYVEGTDLAKLVRQSGPLSITRACTAVRQAALALHYAAGKGLVHGRVKPTNLIAVAPTANGEASGGIAVRLVDFGLTPLAKTASGPEDLHSLGHTLLFLLTGQTLAEVASQPEKLAALPGAVCAVLEKLAADRPEDGYGSAAAAAEALAPLCQESPPEPELPVTVPLAVALLAAEPFSPIAEGIAIGPSDSTATASNGTTQAVNVLDAGADLPVAVAVIDAVASPTAESVEIVAAVAAVPVFKEPVPVVEVPMAEPMPAPVVEVSSSLPPPLAEEPIPLEGIAIPIDGVAVVEAVPVDAVVPEPEPIIAAAEGAAVTPLTVAGEPVPEDIPLATAMVAMGEPMVVAEPSSGEPSAVEVPLAFAPAEVELSMAFPVAAESPSPLSDLTPAAPEMVVPALELTETKSAPAPGPGYATSIPCDAPPLIPTPFDAPMPIPSLELTETKSAPTPAVAEAPAPGSGYATSIPCDAPPLIPTPFDAPIPPPPVPPADAISPTLPEAPAYQPPVDPFLDDAPAESVGAFTSGPTRTPPKPKKKMSLSLKNLSKTQILWLVIGAVLNLVVAPVLIYFIYLQLTSDTPKPRQERPRRAATSKAG